MSKSDSENDNIILPTILASEDKHAEKSDSTSVPSINSESDTGLAVPANDPSTTSINVHNTDSHKDSDTGMVDSTPNDLQGMAPSQVSVNKTCVPENNHNQESHKDVDMADATTNDLPGVALASAKETWTHENDEDLPPWLAQTIVYLRQVSVDRAWQDLVTEFVEFEKAGPPIGVTFDSHL